MLWRRIKWNFNTNLIILYNGVVDDVAPQVSEDKGAGHQKMEDCNFHLSYLEGETENIEAETNIS